MFNNQTFLCQIKPGTEIRKDPRNTQFIRSVLNEDQKVKILRQQEIQSTAENPRIRNQEEIKELTEELKALKHDEYVQEKRRQQLRCNNEELRQLEKQLRAALASKQYAEQLHVLENRKQEQELHKRKENELFELERKRNLAKQQEEEVKEYARKTALRNVLLDQMKEMQEKRKQEYATIMQDRENMQRLFRQLELEDEKERQEKNKIKELNREVMVQSQREIVEREKQRKAENRTGDNAMLKKLEEQELQRDMLREKRIREQQYYAAISYRIGQDLHKQQIEKQRRENLLLDLLVEERNAKEDMRYRQELEKQEELKDEMREELERYVSEYRKQKEHQQKLDDERWLKETEEINAAKDKEEKEKLIKKQKESYQYRHDVLKMMEERNSMRAMDAAEHRQAYEYYLQLQKKE